MRLFGVLPILCLALPATAVEFAASVVRYEPGTGVPAAFSDPQAALGPPTRFTGSGSPFGGAVTPFQPAFAAGELVSLGSGGILELAFQRPVCDAQRPEHFGIDLLVFGNAFYSLSGSGLGTVGPAHSEPGSLEVSQDGVAWSPLAYSADTPFPTRGYQDITEPFPTSAGQVPAEFGIPLPPHLEPLGMTPAQLASAYGRSGGGTGVDLAATGLPWIRFLRITNPHPIGSGVTPEIDAVSVVSRCRQPAGPLTAADDFVMPPRSVSQLPEPGGLAVWLVMTWLAIRCGSWDSAGGRGRFRVA
ncbi:MAG TPA: hypothetical protein VIY86_08620 [Pirellulaceae bacterium]